MVLLNVFHAGVEIENKHFSPPPCSINTYVCYYCVNERRCSMCWVYLISVVENIDELYISY